MSVSGEGMVLLVSLVVGAVWLVLYAWLDHRYQKGRREVRDAHKDYYSWIRDKSIDDLIILKNTPMITIIAASGNKYTMTSEHYKEHKDYVIIESTGAILYKQHIEQFIYFWLGEGVLAHKENPNKRQLVMFKANGKSLASLDDIKWMVTYGLNKYANYELLRTDEEILKYVTERDEWKTAYARDYSSYYGLVNKIAQEERGIFNGV